MKIQFSRGSLTSIPYPDESFNKVICLWGVYNHLLTPPEQIDSLNEIFRVLRPNGLAFIEMGNGERKKYRQIMATIGYGHKNRVWNSLYNEVTPPNILYIHDRQSLRQVAKQSKFEKYQVRFQNINHKRRIVAYLFKT